MDTTVTLTIPETMIKFFLHEKHEDETLENCILDFAWLGLIITHNVHNIRGVKKDG